MILTLENVHKSYGTIRALDGLSFSVDRNEIVAILGPNGAGKTTAIEIALGLRDADSGTARLFGASPRSSAVRRRLGVTPQDSGFPDMLAVDEILRYVAEHYPRPASMSETLARFGLEKMGKRRAGTLSKGESRRLALALAFVGNPELAVLDEPTTGLDVESRRRLWDVVQTVAEGRSIVFTTHYLEEAEVLASRILVVAHGRLLFDGDAQALRKRVGGRRLTYVGEPIRQSRNGDAVGLQPDGRVVVTTDDADAYVRELIGGGTPFTDLEITRPSLEEAFLSLTGALR